MIQTKLNTAIRLSIGGFKSSPIEASDILQTKFHPTLEEKNISYYTHIYKKLKKVNLQ